MAIKFKTGLTMDALIADTDTLVVDATNHRVGIGTASPSHQLHLVGTSTTQIRLQYTGSAQVHTIGAFANGVYISKPNGDFSASQNGYYAFDTIGAIDAWNPFWNGMQLSGHAVTAGGSGVYPRMAIFSRSATATDPTDYEYVFSAGNLSTLAGGVSFGAPNTANSFLRFGFGNGDLATAEGMRVKYDGTNALVGIGKTAPTALLHIGTVSAVGHLRMDGIAGNPGTPTAGDLWYNTSQKAHRLQSTAGTAGLVGLLKAQTSIAGGDTINTTASETNFATNYVLPASSLTVGKTIRVFAAGVCGTLSSGTVTLQIKLKMGSTVLLDSTVITMAISIAARFWKVEARLTVIAVGASGTIECKGEIRIPTANTDTAFALVGVGGDATVTVDTTASQTLQISAQHGASSASNTIKMREFVVEVLD